MKGNKQKGINDKKCYFKKIIQKKNRINNVNIYIINFRIFRPDFQNLLR